MCNHLGAFLLFIFSVFYGGANAATNQGVQKDLPKNERETISSTVGQVGDKVLPSREVVISYDVDMALLVVGIKSQKISRTGWLLKENSEAFRQHLTQSMLELVVNLEAINFSVAEISLDEIKTKTHQINDLLKDWSEWKSIEVTNVELEAIILRKLRAKSFLKFKMESSGVQIRDEEAKLYYDKNRVKFGNLPFDQFRSSIKEFLSKEQLEDKLKDWFELLKRKYKVRYLGTFEN